MTHADAHARGRLLRPIAPRAVEPGGWVAERMREDLDAGFVGHLDRLAPDLVIDDDIFGADRLTAGVTAKDLGAVSEDPAWTVQFLWWNAETQGNWRDGWLRHCLWVGDASHVEAAVAWVERILATQDADGYLGIHAPDLRFPERGEHGELWAQAVLLRALLGYHGHTGDVRVLEAVRRAVERTMAGYPMGASHPFGLEASFGGVTHGLMLTDVLWELADLTGDGRYLAYAAWLYRSFATSPVAAGDARAAALLDPDLGFAGHGVHTYEHWRPLTVAAVEAAQGGGEASLDFEALEAAYAAKLEAALTPTGAPHGDEFCHGAGSADHTGYELCSVQELLHAYGLRVETTGDVSLGDRMESLLFNVGMGMRDPAGTGAAYLKTDNSRSMTGVDGFRAQSPVVPQTRYMYSPLHREAASCCVPNAGRLLPTYARYQWLQGEANGRPQVLALLFGASVLRTEISGVPVVITQETAYPAETSIRFTVEAAGPVAFSLAIRRPAWASDVRLTGIDGARVHRTRSLISVDGPWSGSTTVEAWFRAAPEVRTASSGERLVAQGPLLFALPIPGDREAIRAHVTPGVGTRFEDIHVSPHVPPPVVRMPPDPDLRPAPVPPGTEAARAPHAWQRRALAVDLVDADGHRREHVFVPMGATALRLVAFPPA
ncbi:MAG TPA: beta-L-arabinofuranosidase domain-containing protein [Candidatus Limnocylindrales bacterium]|nr:beta-L-arabinofuranosidase domain-containing protein [Candidatus Limnocylindrales bacterium]